MKLVKHINNNFAVAEDSAGNTIIVQGKGIGYGQLPRIIENFEGIERTYYNINESFVDVINEIPANIITISGKIVDKIIDELIYELSSSVIFTLADHINFGIERLKKNISFDSPIINDVQFLYEEEYKIGLYALDLIKKELDIVFPKQEAAFIALHIISSKQTNTTSEINTRLILFDIVEIIEKHYNLKINKDNFNYSRFSSHMDYFLKRIKNDEILQTSNERLYESVKNEYSEAYECVEKIGEYFNKKLNLVLSNEEKLYLILHVNKMCCREVYTNK